MSRARCEQCLRPLKGCVCDALHPCRSERPLTIWQDPTEAKHPLSTARLLHLSVQPSRLLVADTLSHQDVFPQGLEGVALLYPLPNAEPLDWQEAQSVNELLVLDGTWRKVRRLLHLNPWLLQLPCIRLQPQQSSQYRVRKSPREDGLSTLEATAQCLAWLEQDDSFLNMLSVQQRLVAIQEEYQPQR